MDQPVGTGLSFVDSDGYMKNMKEVGIRQRHPVSGKLCNSRSRTNVLHPRSPMTLPYSLTSSLSCSLIFSSVM